MAEQSITAARPLVIGLPGSFDAATYSSYSDWLKYLPELGVNVRIVDMLNLPGVKHLGDDARGAIYYCDWHPHDYFNLIRSTIDEMQPSEVILLGFSFGAYEAMRAAHALRLLGQPVTGVIAITPTFLDYKRHSYSSVGDWQRRPEAELGRGMANGRLVEQYAESRPDLLSCVRYEDLRNPENGSINTFYMPAEVLQRHHTLRPMHGKVAAGGWHESETAALTRKHHYTTPTLFIAAGASSYCPPARVSEFARKVKHAPVGFVELPGVVYDFRASPWQIERMTETIMDKAGQLLHTKSVHQLPPLQSLMSERRTASERPMDTIVLSSTRPSKHHTAAVRLAKEADTNLVVLTSHDSDPAIVAADLRHAGVKGCVLHIRPDYQLPIVADFATRRHPMVAERVSNLSTKRNIGLLLGYLANQRIFFLDDDIRGLSAIRLRRASAQLDYYRVAGFLSTAVPDNSVVCHAYRLAGGKQEIRIAGSALGVNATTVQSFFPDIYNEDWLFLYDIIKARDAVLIGAVRQLPYNPFNPQRAMTEEFGDVLAEGLYYLLSAGVSLDQASDDFWRYYMWHRRRFIADTVQRLTASAMNDPRIPQALLALGAARKRLEVFTPRDFSTYLQDWRADDGRWRERLAKLPKGFSPEEALKYAAEVFGLSLHLVNY